MSHRIENTENRTPTGAVARRTTPGTRGIRSGWACSPPLNRQGGETRRPSRYAEISARWVIGVYFRFAAILTSFAWILCRYATAAGFYLVGGHRRPAQYPVHAHLPSAITLIGWFPGLSRATRRPTSSLPSRFLARSWPRIALSPSFSRRHYARDRLFSSSIDTLSILCAALLVPLPRDDSLGVPRARGAPLLGRGLVTAVGGIALTTLALWYLCRVGWWPELRHVSVWGVAAARAGHRAYASGTVVRRCHGLYRLCLRWSLPRAGPLSAGPRVPRPTSGTARRSYRIRALLQHYGANDSLSYFATRRDKQVIFSSDRRAAITTALWVRCAWPPATPWAITHAWQDVIERWMLRAAATVGFRRP